MCHMGLFRCTNKGELVTLFYTRFLGHLDTFWIEQCAPERFGFLKRIDLSQENRAEGYLQEDNRNCQW